MTDELDRTLDRITFDIRGSRESLRARLGGARKQRRNALVRSHAVEVGRLARHVEYWIVRSRLYAEYIARNGYADVVSDGRARTFLQQAALSFCGYVAFPKRHAPLSITDDLAVYVPVHGGVSYRVKDPLGAVWGFDFAHLGSEHVPGDDPKFVRWQCQVLYEGLVKAGKMRRRRGRLRIAPAIVELSAGAPEVPVTENFYSALALTFGDPANQV